MTRNEGKGKTVITVCGEVSMRDNTGEEKGKGWVGDPFAYKEKNIRDIRKNVSESGKWLVFISNNGRQRDPVIFHTELLLKNSLQSKRSMVVLRHLLRSLASSYPLASGRSWLNGRVKWPLEDMYSTDRWQGSPEGCRSCELESDIRYHLSHRQDSLSRKR